MKYFQKQLGERIIGVVGVHMTRLQIPMKCDYCRKDLPQGAEVVGKVVEIRKGSLVGARFSPTCFVCADMN